MPFTTPRTRADIAQHKHTGIYDGGKINLETIINVDGETITSTDLPHALLSDTHNDAVAATVSRGSLIHGNATPEWDELTHPAVANRALRTTATDATWAQGDIDFGAFKAISMACDNGAAFPTSPAPTEGQWFLYTPGSRRTLNQYINGAWVPLIGFGLATIAVAKTGNDTTGTGEPGAPYLTIQRAINVLPLNNSGSVVVNIGAGIYAESPLIGGKALASGSDTVTFAGNATYTGAPETINISGITSSTIGNNSGTRTTVTNSGAPWTANAYRGKIVRIVGTTGGGSSSNIDCYQVIVGNSTTIITFAGNAVTGTNAIPRALEVTDTITIQPVSSASESTTVSGIFTVAKGQRGIVNDIKLSATTGVAFEQQGVTTANRCVMVGNFSAATRVLGETTIVDCFLNPTGSGAKGLSVSNAMQYTLLSTSVVYNSGTGTSNGVDLRANSLCQLQGVTIDGFTIGVSVLLKGTLRWRSASNQMPVFIDNCTTPVGCRTDGLQVIEGVAPIISSGTSQDQRMTFPMEFLSTIASVPQVAPVTPLAGHIWNDSTQFTLYEFTNAIRQSLDGAIFTQTANVTVDSAVVTTTETSLVGAGNGTNTLPASWWRSGKSIRVSAAGVISTQAVPGTLRIKIKKGATILLDTLAQVPAGAMVNRLWRITAVITGRSTTTVTGQSYFEYTPAVIGAPQFWEMTNSVAGVAAPLTLATIGTGAEAITITAQWSAASLTDTITLTNLLLESLN